MHINIHSLPSKFDQLKEIIVKLKLNNTQIDFILLCETFLNDENADMYQIPGYSFIQKNRKIKSKGGVGIYISNQYTYIERPDLTTNYEGEFECIMAL